MPPRISGRAAGAADRAAASDKRWAAPRGGGGRGGPGGPGPGGMFGGDASGKRYTLTAGIFAHNLFNNVNKTNIENDILSDRFDEPLGLANIGGPGGNGFNRRIELSLRFGF